ncbi:MAG: aminoacetone oxidase family FAD-binding enzyme [Lachnospiraceae bacterium]|nr:aminoacetone oxidase family FAD-binding enzyme [Lachnospiraceae bacterium]
MNIAVVGGGASGMMAALAAAEKGAEVTLLERNEILGKKLRQTGNGRGNLSNEAMGAQYYHAQDGARIRRWLEKFGTEDTVAFFGGIGVLVHGRYGYLYPRSDRAEDLAECMRLALGDRGVRVRTGALVKQLRPGTEGSDAQCKKGWTIRFTEEGQTLEQPFDRVILAGGGMAAPKTGSDGKGYYMLRQLGARITEPLPALCALQTEGEAAEAAGVRALGTIRIYAKEAGVQGAPLPIGKATGEIQLVKGAISGIPVFQVSGEAIRHLSSGEQVTAELDFLPGSPRQAWEEELEERCKPGRTLLQLFAGAVNGRLATELLKEQGLAADRSAEEVLRETPGKLYRAWLSVKAWERPVTGHADFGAAQTSTGGVPLSDVKDSFEMIHFPGLYVTGEMLDADGLCGGYNLQMAWTSGYLAGRAAAGEVSEL